MENGQTNVTEMMLTLMQSDEFNRRYATFGLTDRPFISFLYLLLMDRSADPHGLDSYAGHLSGGTMTRENVALGMMLSSEFQRKYAAHLGAGQ